MMESVHVIGSHCETDANYCLKSWLMECFLHQEEGGDAGSVAGHEEEGRRLGNTCISLLDFPDVRLMNIDLNYKSHPWNLLCSLKQVQSSLDLDFESSQAKVLEVGGVWAGCPEWGGGTHFAEMKYLNQIQTRIFKI